MNTVLKIIEKSSKIHILIKSYYMDSYCITDYQLINKCELDFIRNKSTITNDELLSLNLHFIRRMYISENQSEETILYLFTDMDF